VKYSLLTFGCRVNQADSLSIEADLRALGGHAVAPDQADVVVVNSCSVTATADQGTRQAVRRVARDNPDARIIVTGCYATRRPEELSALPGVVRVVPNDDKLDVVQLLRSEGLDRSRPQTTAERYAGADGPCGADESLLTPGAMGRTAFTLRVQTGCDEPCAYCIIPATRGTSRSIAVAEVLRDLRRVEAAGYREVTLTGVHLGAYGRDLDTRTSLADLLERALDATNDIVIRIGSLEPMDCTRKILDLACATDRFAPAFHLPLQHASDRMLRAMRRPYTLAQYDELVTELRARLPNASITSDIIVGFPGESDEDADTLVAYLERSPLTQLHVFPYSDRPGTEASRMEPKVHGAIIRERGRRVRDVGARLSSAFVESQTPGPHRALTIHDGTAAVTLNGIRCVLSEGRPRNEWIRLRLRRDDGRVVGEPDAPVGVNSQLPIPNFQASDVFTPGAHSRKPKA
jgi:threonylcarbamoyladenosine tRNA methylthiotransferase MtaB